MQAYAKGPVSVLITQTINSSLLFVDKYSNEWDATEQ